MSPYYDQALKRAREIVTEVDRAGIKGIAHPYFALHDGDQYKLAKALLEAEAARPEAPRRDVPPEIFDSMAVYMELHIEKNEMIKPSMVADVLDALMRLIRKRWKAEAAESPQR